MPTRVIREGINYSEVINQLSDSAELFYRRLLHVADDYGRYWSDVDSIRAGLNLKEKRTPWTRKKVSRALTECFRFKAVLLYGNGRYICIPKFQQQVRRKSKFPEPPEQFLLIGCTSDAALKNVTADKRRMSLGEGEGEAEGEGGGQVRDLAAPVAASPPGPIGQALLPEVPPAQRPTTPDGSDGAPNIRVISDLKVALNGIYKRPPAQSWSYEEDCLLITVSRRSDVLNELLLIANYRRRMPQDERARFFPSLPRLLENWNATLDRARAIQQPRPPAQSTPPAQRPPGAVEITDEQRAEMAATMAKLKKEIAPWAVEKPPGEKAGDTGK